MEQEALDRIEAKTNQALFLIYELQTQFPIFTQEEKAYLEVAEEMLVEFQMHLGINKNEENNIGTPD